ncbi:YIP1 family protein [bacterium]|nr:YIP1 family protein [bacterium]
MNVVSRAQGIILNPKEEWKKIKDETIPLSQLFTSYVLILAAIPAVARFLGGALIGLGRPYAGLGIGTALVQAIVYYIGSLVTVYIIGLIINALASTFSSVQNRENAMKLAVFSMTPAWIAGILYIIPFLGVLVIFASFYGIYLMYLGLTTPLMETPKEKVAGYLVVIILVSLVVMVVVGMIFGAISTVGGVGGVI